MLFKTFIKIKERSIFSNKMKAEKLCVFYASKYHLSLVLLEYLKHNNIKKYNVVTFLENEIEDEIEILKQRSNINLTNDINFKDTKETKAKEFEIKEYTKKKNMIFIIAGKENYMKEVNDVINKNISNTSIKNVKIINCYDFEMQKRNMTEILKCNDKILYTTGEEKIELVS